MHGSIIRRKLETKRYQLPVDDIPVAHYDVRKSRLLSEFLCQLIKAGAVKGEVFAVSCLINISVSIGDPVVNFTPVHLVKRYVERTH